jgi:hypothetical protein
MRIEPRFPFQVPVAMLRTTASGARQEVSCQLENLSLTGLRVTLREHEDLAPGERLYLTLTISESHKDEPDAAGISISLVAEVVWRRDRDCGLKNISINEADLPLYRNLIECMKS